MSDQDNQHSTTPDSDGGSDTSSDQNNHDSAGASNDAEEDISAFRWSENVAGAAPNTRDYQAKTAHLVATTTVSSNGYSNGAKSGFNFNAEEQQRENVHNANTDKDAINQGLASDPNKARDSKHFKAAVHQIEVRRLQTPKREKASMTTELGRLRPPKEELKSGLELAREFMMGLMAGARAHRKKQMELQFRKDLDQANKLILENALDKDVQQNYSDRQAMPDSNTNKASEAEHAANASSNGRSAGTDTSSKPGEGKSSADADPSARSESQQSTEENSQARGQASGPDQHEAPKSESTIVTPAPVQAQDQKTTAPPNQSVKANGPSPDPAESTGNLGVAAAASVVAPVGAAGLAAAQSHISHKEAGTSHTNTRAGVASIAKGPTQPPAKPKVTVTFQKPSNTVRQERLSTISAANSNEAKPKKPARQGALHAQAAQLPPSTKVVMSKGPAVSRPPRQTLGLGMAIGKFIKEQNAQQSANDRNGPSAVEQAWQKQRQGSSREK